jgi:cyclopropane fatty-acyl-phospholipid synthase-like methyltransferase
MTNAPTGETPPDWEQRYQTGDTPWNTKRPSAELARVLREFEIPRGRALELGCGEGANAVLLAREGFQVTAVDVSPTAIERARKFAAAQGVVVDFRVADISQVDDLREPPVFVFDRGCYHVVRKTNLDGLLSTLQRVTVPGTYYLTLTGNANEETPEGRQGPPRVTAEEICREFAPLMRLVQLREFRFKAKVPDETTPRPLAWSALFRRQ